MQDIESICLYLVTDLSGEDSNIFLLDQDEESCLVYILCASVQYLLALPGKKSASKRQALETTGTTLVKHIPALLEKYASDFSRDGVYRLVEIVNLVRFIPASICLELGAESTIVPILDKFRTILHEHQNIELFEAVCQTMNSLDISLSASTEQFRVELAQSLFEDMLLAQESISISVERDISIYERLSKRLRAFHCLTREFDTFSVLRLDGNSDIWSTLDTLTESALLLLQDIPEPLNHRCQIVIPAVEIVTHVMDLQLLNVAYRYANISGSSKKVKETLLLEQASRLIGFCESLVACREGLGVSFPLPLRFKALGTLMNMYSLINSQPDLSARQTVNPSAAVQQEIFNLVGRILDLLSTADSSKVDVDIANDDIDCQVFQAEIAVVLAACYRMLEANLLQFQFAAPVIVWCSDPYPGLSKILSLSTDNGCGIMIDEIMDHCIDQFQQLAQMPESDSAAVILKDYLDNVGKLLSEALQKVLLDYLGHAGLHDADCAICKYAII